MKMAADTSPKQRINQRRTDKLARPAPNKRRLNRGTIAAWDDKIAEQLSKLEAENARLQRRAARLILEIDTLRGK
jgi:hypothetical protein